MKLEDIEVGMRVEVLTDECGSEFEGEIGFVESINVELTYPIEVDFGYATEVFRPEDLEEFN